MDNITFEDFNKLDLRIGTIVEIREFPKANKPAYQLIIDFGPLGVKQSSAQITTLYSKEDLLQRQIVANVNFEPKQVANFKSECLILGGISKDNVVLLEPTQRVPNGSIVQ